MNGVSTLERLACAMLVGAAFACQQIHTTYYRLLRILPDGSHVYGFCAIGCANLGVLGRVPQNISVETHHFGRLPLEQALGVDWEMPVSLPDGSCESLLGAVSRLNDREQWAVPRIAAWLLMLSAGWTVHANSLHRDMPEVGVFALDLERYHSLTNRLMQKYWRQPQHAVWKMMVDPGWWASMPERSVLHAFE